MQEPIHLMLRHRGTDGGEPGDAGTVIPPPAWPPASDYREDQIQKLWRKFVKTDAYAKADTDDAFAEWLVATEGFTPGPAVQTVIIELQKHH